MDIPSILIARKHAEVEVCLPFLFEVFFSDRFDPLYQVFV